MLPHGVLYRYVQQGEQRRQCGLELTIKRQNLPDDLLSDRSSVVSSLDPEVCF
jgi:hypothetical protein